MKYIVEADWVKEHLDELIVIDCRFHLNDPSKGREEYLHEHLPNAVYFDLEKDLSGEIKKHGGRHPLPELPAFINKLEDAGVSNQNTIVVYDDQNSAMASRLWWLLSYLGHEKTYILNGGFQGWKRKGYPISKQLPEISKKGSFVPNANNQLVASAQDIHENLPSFERKERYLIDSREPKRYGGLEEPIDKKAGHIPGAINIPWMTNLKNSYWMDRDYLQQRFSELDPTKEFIVYCGSGVTACPNILALKEAGFANVKLYPGSWSDWISYKDHPISTQK